jgi:transcriptional regulator with XRE-family HTH domain
MWRVNAEEQRRRDLGDFLKTRREQLVRADLGLPPVGGRRSSGLRREEVSYLSDVSVTWYTWLEQGRDIHPSRQVLDAVARTLRLSTAEHTYLLSLAGYSAPQIAPEQMADKAPASVQRLLDSLPGFPAYVTGPDWGVQGWNAAFAALYPNITTVDLTDRNMLWLVFTDPYLRELMPDWEVASRRFLREFRAEVGPRLGEVPWCDLVARLVEASESFRTSWESHDVEGFTSRERLFRHPSAGDLLVELHRLEPCDHPDLRLMIYTPVLTTDAPERLRLLSDTAAPPTTSSG